MPKIKTESFQHRVANDSEMKLRTTVTFNVNSKGIFYCSIPTEIESYFTGRNHSDAVTLDLQDKKLFAPTLQELTDEIKAALKHTAEAQVNTKVEHVIRFNIESHVSFAVDEAGDIQPNAGYPGANWPSRAENEMFGNHHATNDCVGGYSLKIGAAAYTKTTTEFCGTQKVEYKRYYGEGADHHSINTPAARLNSWIAISLPNAKEIPYSDEAAEFFYNLMYGMAKLSRAVQERTFDINNLQQLIAFTATTKWLPFFGAQQKD